MDIFHSVSAFQKAVRNFDLLLFALVELPQDRQWEGSCLWAVPDVKDPESLVLLLRASYGPGATAEASGTRRACGGTGLQGDCPGAAGCWLMVSLLSQLPHGGHWNETSDQTRLPPRSLNWGLNPQAMNFLRGLAALARLCAAGSDHTGPCAVCCFLREGCFSF